MLAARFFCIIIAIIAYFNLEIKQFNIINAFINANCLIKNALIAYMLPDKFKRLGICAEID